MTILVTGVSGFIGMHVARQLLERGDAVVGIDNLNNYYDVELKKNRLEVLNKYQNFKFQKMPTANKNLNLALATRLYFEIVF